MNPDVHPSFPNVQVFEKKRILKPHKRFKICKHQGHQGIGQCLLFLWLLRNEVPFMPHCAFAVSLKLKIFIDQDIYWHFVIW
jgi:hypothetical protein